MSTIPKTEKAAGPDKRLKAGVMGATGYVGQELCRLLCEHPYFELVMAGSVSYAGRRLDSFNPAFRGVSDLVLTDREAKDFGRNCDVVITALPHGVSGAKVKEMFDSPAVILDHSGDFRFKDPALYEAAYRLDHPCPELMAEAVYGLPEHYRDELKTAKLIANPGCYPTCSLSLIIPLVKAGLIEPGSIIVDAYSGTSGAGRKSDPLYGFSEMGENLKPYGVIGHRHQAEIADQILRLTGEEVNVSFTPHLAPVRRGMLASIYAAPVSASVTQDDLDEALNKYYQDAPFVRVLPAGSWPETRPLIGTNFVDIRAAADAETGFVKGFSALDNLGKGAAAQAIQALNVRFGFPEGTGLPGMPAVI